MHKRDNKLEESENHCITEQSDNTIGLDALIRMRYAYNRKQNLLQRFVSYQKPE